MSPQLKTALAPPKTDIFHAIYASITAGNWDILRFLILYFRRVLYDTLKSRKDFQGRSIVLTNDLG
jgi:hypothetical protein